MFLYVVFLAAVALNVVATVRVLRCSSYRTGQKTFQVLLVWLVPFFGASLVWSYVNDKRASRSSSYGDAGGGYGDWFSFGETSCDDGGCGGDGGGGD